MSMFRAFGRIGKEKLVFDVEFKPINVTIFTNQAFNFKFQVQRGKQKPHVTEAKSVSRSMKNTDVKIISFTERWRMPCTYFVKDGVPEAKTITLNVLKVVPGGNEVVIARKEINLSMHFGESFRESTIELDVDVKKATGSVVKSLTYQVIITCANASDQEILNQCISWRELHE